MAARNSTTRKSARRRQKESPSNVSTLREVRARLAIARAAAYTASAALRQQNADADAEIALTLQRCLGDELDRQIERLTALIGDAAPRATWTSGR
jgi:hypothetical protein